MNLFLYYRVKDGIIINIIHIRSIMNVKIHPGEILSFAVASPSYDATIKAIVMSCLCRSVTKIECPDLSDDVMITLAAIKAVGAGVMHVDGGILISGIDIRRPMDEGHIHINVKSSIPTLCLMLPVASYLYRSVTFEYDYAAIPHLKAYEEIYKSRGLSFEYGDNSVTVSGRLTEGEYTISCPVSFPFLDGLLILCACMEGNSEILFDRESAFLTHLEHTVRYMKLFGVNAVVFDGSVKIPGRQRYYIGSIKPEKDYLKASQLMFLASIRGGTEIFGFKDDKMLSPDVGVLDMMKKCGIPVSETDNGYGIMKCSMPPVTADLGNYPDLIPIMIVRCAFSEGYSVIKGIDRIKYNEYSRITDLIYELRKSGVDVGLRDDGAVIKGRSRYAGSEFSAHSDPIIAAALGVFSACCATDSTINGADVINRWYPEMWEDMRSMGIAVEEV